MGEQINERPLTDNELKALKRQYKGIKTDDLVVIEDPENKAHPLGLIGKRKEVLPKKETEGELKNEPNLKPGEVPGFLIVSSLLYLAREDAKRDKYLDGQYTPDQLALPHNVDVLDDSLAVDHLTHLRNGKTSLRNFRYHSDELCTDLFRHSVSDLSMYDAEISNGLIDEIEAESLMAPKLAENVIVVPVLRAGLAFHKPAMEALPKSPLGLVGLSRDEETAEASWYYDENFPEITEDSIIIVADPMLATGGTSLEVIRDLYNGDVMPKEVRLVCVVATPEGIAAIHAEFPDVKITAGAIDSHLNSKNYIVPGLGDYGDRYMGTVKKRKKTIKPKKKKAEVPGLGPLKPLS